MTDDGYIDISEWLSILANSGPSSSIINVTPNFTTVLDRNNTYFLYLGPLLTSGEGKNAYTLFIADAPTGGIIHNSYALYVNSGNTYLGGDLNVNGTIYGDIDGKITLDKILLTSNGTEIAPGYSWQSDPTTGLYRINPFNIGITLGGTKYIDLSPSNTIINNKLSLTDTTEAKTTSTGALVVTGGVGIGGDLRVAGKIYGTYEGKISLASILIESDGTANDPSYSWLVDSNTGFYRVGENNLGITLGGTKYLDLSPTNTIISNTLSLTDVGGGTPSTSSLYINPSLTTLSTNTYFTYLTAPPTTGTGTNAYTMYIAGAPTGGIITNSYALYVAGGTSHFGGGIHSNGSNPINFSNSTGNFTTTSGKNTINGRLYKDIQSVITSTTTLDFTANKGNKPIIPVNPNGSSITITLPPSASNANNGLEYFFLILSNGTVTITVSNILTETFDNNSTSIVLINANDRMRITSYNGKWYLG
jgi:cytoskeletal protein CcmA (bactofilin family)